MHLFSAAFTLRCRASVQTVAVSGAAEDAEAFLAAQSEAVIRHYPGYRLIGRTVIQITDDVAAPAGYRRSA